MNYQVKTTIDHIGNLNVRIKYDHQTIRITEIWDECGIHLRTDQMQNAKILTLLGKITDLGHMDVLTQWATITSRLESKREEIRLEAEQAKQDEEIRSIIRGLNPTQRVVFARRVLNRVFTAEIMRPTVHEESATAYSFNNESPRIWRGVDIRYYDTATDTALPLRVDALDNMVRIQDLRNPSDWRCYTYSSELIQEQAKHASQYVGA